MHTEPLIVVTVADRPDLTESIAEFPHPFWPVFMHQDPIANRHFGRLFTQFPDYQFALIERATDQIIAIGNSIPMAFRGSEKDLPDEGWDWAIEQGFADADNRLAPYALCALQIVVDPSRRGQGLSAIMIRAMRAQARSRDLDPFIAPVRPNQKARYPLTPIEEYVTWKRSDGMPFDPWLRAHIRLGAEIVRVCPRAMTIPGTVGQWEQWTDLAFPVDGRYAIPGALAPITIDRQADTGLYIEPNVWVWHALSAGGHLLYGVPR